MALDTKERMSGNNVRIVNSHALSRVGDDGDPHGFLDGHEEGVTHGSIWPVEKVEDHAVDQVVLCQLKEIKYL